MARARLTICIRGIYYILIITAIRIPSCRRRQKGLPRPTGPRYPVPTTPAMATTHDAGLGSGEWVGRFLHRQSAHSYTDSPHTP
jgi:hypothetical protein